MSTPEDPTFVMVYDGIEYDLPLKPTPREDGRLQQLSGFSFVQIVRDRFEALDTNAMAGLLIIAMARRHGTVDADKVLDDLDFITKFELRQVEAVPLPPVDAAPAAANGSPSTSPTLARIGPPTSL